MNFSIVIPVYNEEKNISKLIEEIYFHLFSFKNIYELILVNDCSNDNTLFEINNIKKQTSSTIKIINNLQNIGQSLSLYEGIKSSSYNTIVTLDADGQNNPKDIPKLIDTYFSNTNIFLVGGIRFDRKDSVLKIVSSKIANKIRSKILKDNCIDTGCSLKVFDKDVFMKFPMFNGIHRFLPALFKGYGKDTLFLNVDHRPRIFGKSKYGTVGRLFKGINDLIRVLKIIKKFNS